jgi:hypothetical protein
MPYSESLKVFWFTPMRTASRSCNELLRHLDFTDFSHELDKNKIREQYYFVSNIRNPYSRLVSIYHLYCYHRKKEPNDFRDWATKQLGENVHYPIYQIFLSKIFSSCNKLPDYFVRQEFLEEDIRNLWFIKDSMSEHIEYIIQNTIVSNRYFKEFGKINPWQEYYDDSLSNYVYNFLEKDFQLFGYDKNSWKNGTP